MKQVTHAPGTFCWAELITSDSEAAKKFYGELFGWKYQDDEIPGGGVYTMIQLGDSSVGGQFQITEEMKAMNVPPHWLSYVSIEDVEKTAEQAKAEGGKIIREPMDVMDIGRMAVLSDPTGAVFALWQPKTQHGTDLTGGKPFSMCWNELMTRDVPAASQFYTQIFPWKAESQQMGPIEYTIFKNGEAQAAGMLSISEEWGDAPANWMIYFAVDDCDARTAKVESLGGKVIQPPFDIPPVGRMSVLQDPQGAYLSIIKLST